MSDTPIPTARVQRGRSEAARCASTGDQPGYPSSAAGVFSILLICNLAFLEQLIQKRVFLFGIFVVLERLGEIFQGGLPFPLLRIVFADAVIGPRVLVVELEGSVEGFVGVLHMLSAQRQPADC